MTHAVEVPERTLPYRELLSVLLLLVICIAAVAVGKPDGDPDLFARLAVGRLVVQQGAVPHQDPFAYTAKRPEWVDHEWGSGVVFYAVAAATGEKGLLLLKALLMFGTVGFVYLRARRRTGRAPSLLFHVFLLWALHLGFVSTIRSQTFTFLLFSAWLYLLERAQRGQWRGVWTIPLVGIVWANLHGGFLAGVGLVGLFAAGAFIERRPVGRFAALAVASALASAVNPYGLRYWSYLLDATTMDRGSVVEWGAPGLFGTDIVFLGFRILLALTALAIVTRALRKDLPSVTTLATLVVTAGLGLRTGRHTTFFIITAAPFVCAWLAVEWAHVMESTGAAERLPPLAEAVGFGLSRGLLLMLALAIVTGVPLRIVLMPQFPVRAVDFIAENNLRGNLLVPFNFGSYAIWRLYPECRVSMDGRYETVYLESTFEGVSSFFAGTPGAAAWLDRYAHDLILESPRSRSLEAQLTQRADWTVAYEDAMSRVYVRAAQARAWTPLSPLVRRDPVAEASHSAERP